MKAKKGEIIKEWIKKGKIILKGDSKG